MKTKITLKILAEKMVTITFLWFLIYGLQLHAQNGSLNNNSNSSPKNLSEVKLVIGYPEVARKLGITGQIIFEIEVSPAGEYLRHKLKSRPIPILTPACEKYLSRLKFTSYESGQNAFVEIPFFFHSFNAGREYQTYKKGLSKQSKKDYVSAIAFYTKSIKEKNLFQLHSYIQRAVCYYLIDEKAKSSKDFRRVLKKRHKYIDMWKSEVEVNLIEHPYILSLEHKAIKEIESSGNMELDHLVQQLKKEYKLE